jgi:hypothetical protein
LDDEKGNLLGFFACVESGGEEYHDDRSVVRDEAEDDGQSVTDVRCVDEHGDFLLCGLY